MIDVDAARDPRLSIFGDAGPVFLESGSGGRVEFRNIEIREINSLPPEILKSEISNLESQISDSPSPFDILSSPCYEWSGPENEIRGRGDRPPAISGARTEGRAPNRHT